MNNKNILLIMTDQHRNDYVGYMPGGKAVTPNIDWIAGGCGFEACQSGNPLCVPARTSLATGRYARQVGMRAMSGDLFPQIPTFMSALQKNGYTTYAIGKLHYLQTWDWGAKRNQGINLYEKVEEMKKFGYDYIWETAGKQLLHANYCSYAHYLEEKGLLEKARDFVRDSGGPNGDTADRNYDTASAWPFAEEDYIDVVTGRKACEALEQHPSDKPFYMLASFCSPHKTYDAPQRYLDMFELEEKDDFILQNGQSIAEEDKMTIYRQRRNVKAMLKLVDDQIGNILNVLRSKDLLDKTMIIFTSDHGDGLGDHFMIQKGIPWKQVASVPLAIRMPGYADNKLIKDPVELTDVSATILDYAGLDPQSALSRSWPKYNNVIPCRSLLPVVRGEVEKVRDYTFTEADFSEEHPFLDDPNAGLLTPEEVMKKRGEGRGNKWEMIQTRKYKYIKYLGYEKPGVFHEELYDLENDPDELYDVAKNPEYADYLKQGRDYLMFTVDHYPTAQLTWMELNIK